MIHLVDEQKLLEKLNFSTIRTRTCVYQGVRNFSFFGNSAYVLHGWNHKKIYVIFLIYFNVPEMLWYMVYMMYILCQSYNYDTWCIWCIYYVNHNKVFKIFPLTFTCSKRTKDRERCEMCSKLTIKIRRSGVFINFERISHFFLDFLLLTLNV